MVNRIIFVQDNSLIYTLLILRRWLDNHFSNVLEWPPFNALPKDKAHRINALSEHISGSLKTVCQKIKEDAQKSWGQIDNHAMHS